MTNSRNTIQRQLVLSAVRQLQNHPTADEVYQEVQKKLPDHQPCNCLQKLKTVSRRRRNSDFATSQVLLNVTTIFAAITIT